MEVLGPVVPSGYEFNDPANVLVHVRVWTFGVEAREFEENCVLRVKCLLRSGRSYWSDQSLGGWGL